MEYYQSNLELFFLMFRNKQWKSLLKLKLILQILTKCTLKYLVLFKKHYSNVLWIYKTNFPTYPYLKMENSIVYIKDELIKTCHFKLCQQQRSKSVLR